MPRFVLSGAGCREARSAGARDAERCVRAAAISPCKSLSLKEIRKGPLGGERLSPLHSVVYTVRVAGSMGAGCVHPRPGSVHPGWTL